MAIRPLNKGMVFRIVDKFIGVDGGHLVGFSVKTLWEFYPEYCDLDISPRQGCGTKRDCFTTILLEAEPKDQAKILGGLLKKCPVGEECSRETRTQEFAEEIQREIQRLQEVSPVDAGHLAITVDVVERAIEEAKILLQKANATSAVDRFHMTIHSYVKGVCVRNSITLNPSANLPQALSALRNQHPNLKLTGPHSREVQNMLQVIFDSFKEMNTIRNWGSMAH